MILRCLRVLREVYKNALLACITYILLNVVTAFIATFDIFITENLVNSVEDMIFFDKGIKPVVFFGGIMLLSIVFTNIQMYCKTIAELSITKKLSGDFLNQIVIKLRKLEYSCFENPSCLDYLNLISSAPHEKFKMCYLKIISTSAGFFSLLGILVYFISVSPVIALIYWIIVMLAVYINLRAAKWYDDFEVERSTDERKAEYLNKLIIEKDSLCELKIFGSLNYIISKWKLLIGSILNQKIKIMVKTQKYYFLSLTVMVIYSFLTTVYISINVIHGEFRLGLLVAFISAIGRIFITADQFADAVYELGTSLNDVQYYEKFMELPEICPGQVKTVPDKPDIVFENVYFTYPDTTKEVLHDVSFKITAGEKVAVVGENGAGKSTIIKLILGLYSPTKGKIFVGGIPLELLNQEAKQAMFSAVFQDYAHYAMSLFENIALDENDTQNVRLQAEKVLHTVDLREDFVAGMATMLGKMENDGIDLSGGQWQKIAIARGLFHYSRYLVLDEPVASLDPISESHLYSDFLNASDKSDGIIIVSHRLASARLCSRIIVIKDGRIAEDGSHEELIAKKGEYAFMYQAQSAWYKENA